MITYVNAMHDWVPAEHLCSNLLCPVPAAAQQRNHADDEVVVAQMREQLLARMQSLGSLQPPAEATACLEVSRCTTAC